MTEKKCSLDEKEKCQVCNPIDYEILEKAKETQSRSCLAAAGATMLIGFYCDPEKQDCDSLADDFIEGISSLEKIAEDLNVNPEILELFKNEGIEVDKTFKELLKEEGLTKEEVLKQLDEIYKKKIETALENEKEEEEINDK